MCTVLFDVVVRVGHSLCLGGLVEDVRGKVVGIIAKVHHYKGSCLLFGLFDSCLGARKMSSRRVVGISLRSHHGGGLQGPSTLLRCVSTHVTGKNIRCIVLSRMR